MSVVVKAKFKCPHCGEEFESNLYKAVNIDDDENYRHMLINGQFFNYHCPGCNQNFMAVYPLSYTDPKHKFMIQYTPVKIKDQIIDMVATNRNKLPLDFTVRVVVATYDLVEKMLIFENLLDDRAIEINKVIIHKAFLDKFPGKQVNHIYFNKSSDGEFFFDVVYNNDEGKQEISRAQMDMKLYNKIYRDFRKDFKDDDLIIDYGYGLAHIQEANKRSESEK